MTGLLGILKIISVSCEVFCLMSFLFLSERSHFIQNKIYIWHFACIKYKMNIKAYFQ